MRGADGLTAFWLAFLPVGLALVGVGVVYDLHPSAWAIPAGALLGMGVGAAFVRDFLRWRFGWLSWIGGGAFLMLFVVSQYLVPVGHGGIAVRLVRISLIGAGLAFAGIGVGFLVAPAALGERVGLALTNATADNDVRAVYGGLSTGLALFFWRAAARPAWFRPALFAQVLAFGGLAAGRLVSLLAVGAPEPLGIALHGGEALGLAVGLVALRRTPPADGAGAA